MRYLPYFLLGWLLLASCQERDPAYIEPAVDFSLDKDTYEVFEIMRVTNRGQGQFYSVFTGDAGHRYARRDSGDTGFKTDVNGNFTYSYTSAGVYTVTFVASGYRLESGERVERIAETQVTVTDPDISNIRIQAMEVGNSAVRNNKFLDPITFLFKDFRNTADTIDNENQKVAISYYRPERMGEISGGQFNPFVEPADINIIPVIELNTTSNTVRLQIEGADPFANGQTRIPHETEDGLRFQEKAYEVVNQQGQRKAYTVCPMIIPEFMSFELAGESGLVELSPGDYNQFQIKLDLPDTTDRSSLVPTWTFYDQAHTQTYVKGVAQVSGGSPQDFSSPVTYLLEYTQPKGPEDTYNGSFEVRAWVTVSVE